ncbi:hypothetical protein DL770_008337 [Monosporascus sp. CRB-9-2]|nr:hypothetical protein DL770_008337 [Monosporascus sp. CRB-9-2]
MPRVFRGETTILEELRESGLLDDYYTQGFGFKQVCKWLSRVLVQISNRYPHMNILGIGAIKSILPALDRYFITYTFTDVSAGFAIVGGKTAKSAYLVEGLHSILKPYACNIHVFKTLANVDYGFADAASTVVSLDEAVFDGIQPSQWQDLKQICEVGKTLLWLTSGREADQPYANMMVGFGRTAHLETPGLRLQFLDTVESEIIMDASGRHLVPQLRAIPEPNDRYNSGFRPIQHEADIGQSAVQLQRESSGYLLKELPHYGTSGNSEMLIELRITHSLLYALATPVGHKFLVLGDAKDAGTKYMALVPSLTSVLNVPVEAAVSYNELTILATLPRHVRRETPETLHSPDATPAVASSTGILSDLVQWALRLDSRPMFKARQDLLDGGIVWRAWHSLRDWMIGRGARSLVLTSRNPNIAPKWVQAHDRKGVKVTIIPCIYLDRIFDRQPLDFFIFFSSINCVVGNLGQAHYAAANMFMCATAANRRKSGLTACTLNVNAIIGAGYTERVSSKALSLTVSKMALMHLSEEDFHQLFAEGIEAGLPHAVDGPEISTGILDIAADADGRPRWCKDLKFLRFINHWTGSSAEKFGQAVSMSMSDMLKGCKTEGELLMVIQGTFGAQLRKIIQMTTPDAQPMAMRSSEIGLDSLISVDVRAWFLKNFHVSILVLKIMGNETVANLAKYAAENIPPELVPQIRAGEGQDAPAPLATPPASPSKGPTSTDGASSSEASPIESKMLAPNSRSSAAITIEQSPPPPAYEDDGVDGTSKIDYDAELTPLADLADLAIETGNRHERVTYFEGDLRSVRLGLSEEDAAAIFKEIDVVIHNGADTSQLKYYPVIKGVNVDSTRWLTRMCLPRQIPMHYVSSVGMSLFSPGRMSFPPTSATDASPPPDGSHGYIASGSTGRPAPSARAMTRSAAPPRWAGPTH